MKAAKVGSGLVGGGPLARWLGDVRTRERSGDEPSTHACSLCMAVEAVGLR